MSAELDDFDDEDRCEVEGCDSTDDVRSEMTRRGTLTDPPEYLLVCRGCRERAEDWDAEDRAYERGDLR